MTTPAQPATFRFDWMNGGQAFDLSSTRITPAAHRASKVVKRHAFLEACRDIPPSLAPEARQAMVEEAKQHSIEEQAAALVHGALVQVDPKVKDITVEDLMAKLDFAKDFIPLSKAVTAGLKVQKGDGPKGASPPS